MDDRDCRPDPRYIVNLGRRQLLRQGAVLLGALPVASRALAAPCAAPDANDSSLRQALHYVESGPDSKQHCSGCSFFSDPKADCGTCQIFSGPANVNGHCDSWAARG